MNPFGQSKNVRQVKNKCQKDHFFFFISAQKDSSAFQILTALTCSYFKYAFLLLTVVYMDRIHLGDDRAGHNVMDRSSNLHEHSS